VELIDYPISTVAPQNDYCHPKLNAPLAGGDRLRASGDRFMAGSRDVPLFGANLGVILTDEGAFGFLSGMGINFVRINAPYREWTDSGVRIFERTPLDISRRDLDDLLRMQALCEKYGVYMLLTDFNRGIGRDKIQPQDARDFATFSPDATSLGIWHPDVRATVIERIRRLLRTRNPHTGKSFGASPSLFGIQPVNEVMWFGSDLERTNSRIWDRLQTARTQIKSSMGIRAANSPADRFRILARATADAYSEVKSAIIAETGNDRPLLIADMAPFAGGAAFSAFAPCDAYGLNVYPEIGDHANVNGPIKPSDLRPEPGLNRIQARLGGKPTIITEVGDKLAPGGNARLVAEMTVRAGTVGFAGLAFHQLYRGIYGEYSNRREHLASRAPLTNFEFSTDPAAQVAIQACSIIHRKRLIRTPEERVRIERTVDEWISATATFGGQPHDLQTLAARLSPAASRALTKPEVSFVLVPSSGASARTESYPEAGTIQLGHVRVGFVEIDWHTDPNPEQDWLFIRVPLEANRRLIVLVGRAKPDPAQQRFSGGQATLTGLIRYSWPDPRTGYGTRQLVRRPSGPRIFVSGQVFLVRPDGGKSLQTAMQNLPATLPTSSIRFVEELPEPLILRTQDPADS